MYIKPEFEKELKKLKIKTIFIKNFNDQFKRLQGTYRTDIKRRRLAQLNKEAFFHIFITFAFSWENTPQGYKFWLDIYERYSDKYYACYRLNKP